LCALITSPYPAMVRDEGIIMTTVTVMGCRLSPCSQPGAETTMKMIATNEIISCRIGCGACCIAPSLSSRIPGMPDGKPAGVRCVQLSPDNQCEIYGRPDRPAVCLSYQASESCGTDREHALRYLEEVELKTSG